MFPRTRIRLLLAMAIVVGAASLHLAHGALRSHTGASGLTLTQARSGFVMAAVLVALAGLPVAGLGTLASAVGNPLSGLFAVGSALLLLAWTGGPIDGWMRTSSPPGSFGALLIELLVWQLGVVAMLALVQKLRSPLRTRWPALAFDDHLGVDTHIRLPQAQALGAGLVCAIVAGVLGHLLIRSSDINQVLASLLVAFAVGGMAGHMAFPQSNPAAILLSPAIVAATGYALVLTGYTNHGQLLAAWHAGKITGLAMALPVHYASAGLAGAAMGVGWAQGLMAPEAETSKVTS
jgi:hypothetical protein